MLDIAGHISYTFILIGMICISRKNVLGFPLRFIGECGWIAIGFIMGMSSIWSWGILFCLNDLYGWWRWKNR